jgi:hypothetical protein
MALRQYTHIVVALNHLPEAHIVAYTVSWFVRVNLFLRLRVFICSLSPLVLVTLRSLHIGHSLLTVLASSNVALRWRLLARAHASWRG